MNRVALTALVATRKLLQKHGADLVFAAWVVSSFVFALRRVPYDDELFSITVARDADRASFWWTLAHDVHPPWVALFDRLTMSVIHDAHAINATHLLASVLAILLIRSLAPSLGLGRLAVVLAAFHPIVFMYAPAARWYAFAFLADSLRAWALWYRGPGATARRRGAAFIAGALLGAMAGYAEAILIAIDGTWWLVSALRARREGKAGSQIQLATLAIAAALCIASLFASPYFLEHARRAITSRTEFPPLRHAPWIFLGFGLVGEAFLAPPWTWLAAIALPGYIALLVRAREIPRSLWLTTVLLGWLAASRFGIAHPRYSLMIWLLLGAYVLELARDRERSWWLRVPAITTCAWLAFALVLTLGQRSFVKSNLDAMSPEACAAIQSTNPDLIVAPYPITATQIERTCATRQNIVTANWVRHYDDDTASVAPIAKALAVAGAREISMVEVPTGGSSLEDTYRATRPLLEKRCREVSSTNTDPDVFAELKGDEPRSRYRITRYHCNQ